MKMSLKIKVKEPRRNLENTALLMSKKKKSKKKKKEAGQVHVFCRFSFPM